MLWALPICFAIGALCALKIPVLHFAIVVMAVMAVYTIACVLSGGPVVASLLWMVLFAVSLEAGYVFDHLIAYLTATRVTKQEVKTSASKLRSRYSPD